MEGTLLKWTNYLFGWRERWFVLRGNVLYYYYKKNEKPKGRIHLGVVVLSFTDADTKFELDTGTSVIYIKAGTKELKDSWVQAIKISKLDAENKLSVGNLNLSGLNNFSLSNTNSNTTNINQMSPTKLNFDNLDYSSNTNRNSVITEDKLLRKINNIQQNAEKITFYNNAFAEYLRKNQQLKSDDELQGIYKKYKVNLFYIT
jgi:hypothetical protein